MDGNLADSGDVVTGKFVDRIKNWDIIIQKDMLQHGYSGSPLIDRNKGSVSGVITHMLDNGKKGAAVSIEALADIWSDMPEYLLSHGKTINDKNYGRLITRMCNRGHHDHKFKEFFLEKCSDKQCQNQPQFYIIHGNEGQCHNSLVERLHYTYIKNFVRQEWKEKTILPRPYKVSWLKDSKLDICKKRLKHEIFSAVNPRYMGADYSINSLCSMPGIKEYNVVIIVHYIQASDWMRSCSADLLKWYMQDFWSMPECCENMPQFFIFLNVEYPVPTQGGGLLKMLYKKEKHVKNRVKKDIETVYNSVKDSCNCLLIEELEPVSKEDVKKWFWKYTGFNDAVYHGKIKDFFQDADFKNMAEIEEWLQEIYDNIYQEKSDSY